MNQSKTTQRVKEVIEKKKKKNDEACVDNRGGKKIPIH